MNKKIIQKLKQVKILTEECLFELSSKKASKEASDIKLSRLKKDLSLKINFNMSARAFVKKYAKGMSYSKKFTLLIAYLSKGKTLVDVSLKNVEKIWKRMTAKDLLKGKFNRSYSTKAKTQGWIREGTKTGFYQLDLDWMNIFKSK
jgi:hypothetical protein